MKTKLFGLIVITAITFLAGYNVYTSQDNQKISDLALANVEALANGEGGGSYNCCNDRGECKGSYCGEFTPAGSSTSVSVYYK